MNARQARRGVVTLSVVGGSCLVLLSAGCAKSGAMSCADYGQKGYSERGALVREMIREHGLDPQSNAMAAAKVVSDVDTFCGTQSFPGTSRPASKNSDMSIEKGVMWAAYSR